MRTSMSTSAERGPCDAGEPAPSERGSVSRTQALERPVAALLDARRDPGERRQRAELATAAGELERRDVVLHAVVVGGERGGPEEVDRAVRPDQTAAGEGRRGRQDRDERGAPAAAKVRRTARRSSGSSSILRGGGGRVDRSALGLRLRRRTPRCWPGPGAR